MFPDSLKFKSWYFHSSVTSYCPPLVIWPCPLPLQISCFLSERRFLFTFFLINQQYFVIEHHTIFWKLAPTHSWSLSTITWETPQLKGDSHTLALCLLVVWLWADTSICEKSWHCLLPVQVRLKLTPATRCYKEHWAAALFPFHCLSSLINLCLQLSWMFSSSWSLTARISHLALHIPSTEPVHLNSCHHQYTEDCHLTFQHAYRSHHYKPGHMLQLFKTSFF
jgi:hypothetical protein